MGADINAYDALVTKNILANNEFGIKKVINLESLKVTYFTRDSYSEIENLIKRNDIKSIKALPNNSPEFEEYLDIMTFNDQQGDSFIITIYDSIELNQDPQIISVYKC
jgi:hypothetical protein